MRTWRGSDSKWIGGSFESASIALAVVDPVKLLPMILCT